VFSFEHTAALAKLLLTNACILLTATPGTEAIEEQVIQSLGLRVFDG